MVPKCTQIKALAVFLGVYYAPFSHPGPWVGFGGPVEAYRKKVRIKTPEWLEYP